MNAKEKKVTMLYGKSGITLSVPETARILKGPDAKPLENPQQRILEALNNPIGTAPLEKLLRGRNPETVAITISDITRPVPNKQIIPPILSVLNRAGISDAQVVIIIGTGMHRPSTPEEREILLGSAILNRIEVVDHQADVPETLMQVSDEPPVHVCRRFAEADFRIVTGFIEPHFMAGFSGGRKGVCPALVDLRTVQRFHGYRTLANLNATSGMLETNPCHEIALNVAKEVGVDFLVNVGLTHKKEIAGIYCGDLEAAHLEGCRQVGQWTSASVEQSYDLVITCGGGYPLDQSFYQTTKGICGALPALDGRSTLLAVSHCGEGLGSDAFSETLLEYDNDWERFLNDIETASQVILDQWGFHMLTRVLEKIGIGNLRFISDGIAPETQKHISVSPVLGEGNAQERAQEFIDEYLRTNPDARVAVIPDGPYTMLTRL